MTLSTHPDNDAETDRVIALIDEMKNEPKPLVWITQQAAELAFDFAFLMAFLNVCRQRMTLEQHLAEKEVGLVRCIRARFEAWKQVRQAVLRLARKSMDPDFLYYAWQNGYIAWYHYRDIKAKIDESKPETDAPSLAT